jgi:hypothetical protein
MKNLAILYAILLLIILAIAIYTYAIMPAARKKSKHDRRRRWGRIKVPENKTMTCRILEPESMASGKDYQIDDINVGGISFISDKALSKRRVRLSIKFPFTSYQEAGIVNGKIVYCNELKTKRFRIGVGFVREKK